MNIPECTLIPLNRHVIFAQVESPWKKHASLDLSAGEKFRAFMYGLVVTADPDSAKLRRGMLICMKKGQADELMVDEGMRLLTIHESFVISCLTPPDEAEFTFKDLGAEVFVRQADEANAEISRRRAAMFQNGMAAPEVMRMNG